MLEIVNVREGYRKDGKLFGECAKCGERTTTIDGVWKHKHILSVSPMVSENLDYCPMSVA